MLYTGEDRRRLRDLRRLAREARVPADRGQRRALSSIPSQRDLQDVVTCIRERVTLKKPAQDCRPTPNAI